MALKKKITDYSKTGLIKHLRALADSDRDWKKLQTEVLPYVSCVGELPPPHPEFPKAPRRPKENTAMSTRDIRHCLRDICESLKMLGQASNKKLDEAWISRDRAQTEYVEFAGKPGGWGKSHDLLVGIEKIADPAMRVSKRGIVEGEKRRLCAVADEAANRFASVEDKRFFIDQTRKRYPSSFVDVHDWVPPTGRDPRDLRSMLQLSIDEIDFDELDLDGSKVYFVQHISGRYVGNSQTGPMFFRLKTAAYAYTDNEETLSLRESLLHADVIREVVRWYGKNHKFILSEPADALWLYSEYPELTNTRPEDDGEFQEAMETATVTEGW